MVIIPITLSDRKFAIEMPLSRKFSDKRITCLRRKIWRYQKGKSDDVTSRTDSTMDRRKWQYTIHKTLHSKLQIEQHES